MSISTIIEKKQILKKMKDHPLEQQNLEERALYLNGLSLALKPKSEDFEYQKKLFHLFNDLCGFDDKYAEDIFRTSGMKNNEYLAEVVNHAANDEWSDVFLVDFFTFTYLISEEVSLNDVIDIGDYLMSELEISDRKRILIKRLSRNMTERNNEGISLILALSGNVLKKKDYSHLFQYFGINLKNCAPVNWSRIESRKLPLRYGSSAACLGNRIFLSGGRNKHSKIYSDLWIGEEGGSWKRVRMKGPRKRFGHSMVSFKDTLWIFGGNSSEDGIWYSSDGQAWESVEEKLPFKNRFFQSVCEFNGHLWAIGGCTINNDGVKAFNDIWCSFDGRHWFKIDIDVPFNERFGHSLTVHNEALWLIGGRTPDDQETLGDIWKSEDGENWSPVRLRADRGIIFSPRHGHSSFSWNGALWVFGGNYESENRNDLWASDDGIHWTFFQSPVSARSYAAISAYEQQVSLIGGRTDREDNIWRIN